jgi:hypothetical protein
MIILKSTHTKLFAFIITLIAVGLPTAVRGYKGEIALVCELSRHSRRWLTEMPTDLAFSVMMFSIQQKVGHVGTISGEMLSSVMNCNVSRVHGVTRELRFSQLHMRK